MTNTTQLLIDAAKAAGYEVQVLDNIVGGKTLRIKNRTWNPSESNADAFRLMVDCRISVRLTSTAAETRTTSPEKSGPVSWSWQPFEEHNNDKRAATRMAIVRAAAQSQERAE